MAERPVRVPGVEARAGRFPGPSLIPDLEALQERLGWLPREELEELSRRTRRPLYEIQGLVSFYPHFRTDPPRPVSLQVCRDLSCWLRGGEEAAAALRDRYGGDEDVELREVSCPGRCDTAPAARVGDRPAVVGEVGGLVDAVREGRLPPRAAVAGRPVGGWPNDPYAVGEEPYQALRALLRGELDTVTVVDRLKESGLRGMGGAGFPTGTKWELVAQADDPLRYAVCNADESEPGTFKDRRIIVDQQHLVLEGMLLGMLVTRAEHGWFFVRHEYGPEEDVVRAELDRLRAVGLLGDDVLGTGRRLDVEVFTSPGGYILGEETALLECLEGHRGEPRNKPPFPGTYGLWGHPTLINSVETFAHVPAILLRGPEWWRAKGVNGSTGLKFFAVSGHVERPGVYCVPLGTTVRDLLELAGGVLGGADLAAVQPGGASSNFLGPDQLDVPLDFSPLADAGTMLGSGALVVMADGTNLLAAATNVLRFFRDESCGKCVPCRVGSAKAHELLVSDPRLAEGRVADDRRQRLVELEAVMRRTSICGLGQVALGPVVSVLGLDRGATEARPHPRG
ncbi:MAG TPA: NAD(P)H-dependent oxidoreductase subunit E [Jiangellales bacterium]|nr:NAD(P)H-dependent oxidoreductase subunit E [Jiangellales bacterium]